MIIESRATVVSLCPFPIREIKPGLRGGEFFIPPAESDEKPQVLKVSQSGFSQRLPATEQVINIPVHAHELAESIVKDFASTHIASGDDSKPGLFWVDGHHDAPVIKVKFKDQYEEAKRKQINWFKELVKLADDDWGKFRQHKMITEIQIRAAKVLGVEREWAVEFVDQREVTKDCPACQKKIALNAIKCAECGAILDKEKFKQFQL